MIEDIWWNLYKVQGEVIHIFREDNIVADALANEVVELKITKGFQQFIKLPDNIRRHINMGKYQIPKHTLAKLANLRISY